MMSAELSAICIRLLNSALTDVLGIGLGLRLKCMSEL